MSEKKKILIVDDEPDIVDYLASLLEDNGYSIIKAFDGKVGMEMVKKEKPDLISLDITMPEETGVRMLRNLHDDPETVSIPVILVTGVDVAYKDFLDKRKQITPPLEYFEKPIDKEKFLATVRKILS